jgi:hypothetical protein
VISNNFRRGQAGFASEFNQPIAFSTLSLFTCCLMLFTSGCNPTSSPNYSDLGLVEIGGRVLLDGQAMPNVEVRLVTAEDGIYSYGVSDDNGRYSLMFDSRTRGIIPGKKQVVIVSASAKAEGGSMDEEEAEETEGAPKKKGESRIPKCYGRDSKYIVEVVGTSNSFDIELKADCSNSR